MEPANVTEAKDIGMFVELRRFSDKARGLMEKPNKGDLLPHNFDPPLCYAGPISEVAAGRKCLRR